MLWWISPTFSPVKLYQPNTRTLPFLTELSPADIDDCSQLGLSMALYQSEIPMQCKLHSSERGLCAAIVSATSSVVTAAVSLVPLLRNPALHAPSSWCSPVPGTSPLQLSFTTSMGPGSLRCSPGSTSTDTLFVSFSSSKDESFSKVGSIFPVVWTLKCSILFSQA